MRTAYNATDGGYVIGHGGGVHAQHTWCMEIDWDEAIPGDLVFYPEDERVGIVCGRDENGELRSYNNVVITGTRGFASVARPVFIGSDARILPCMPIVWHHSLIWIVSGEK